MIIKDKLNELLIAAIKEKNSDLIRLLKLVKSEFMVVEKSRPASQELTEAEEEKILRKMVSQRKDSIEKFVGRDDLIAKEQAELDVLLSWLPKEPDPEEIETEIKRAIINTAYHAIPAQITLKDTGKVLGEVRKKYPNVDGKLVNEMIKKYPTVEDLNAIYNDLYKKALKL